MVRSGVLMLAMGTLWFLAPAVTAQPNLVGSTAMDIEVLPAPTCRETGGSGVTWTAATASPDSSNKWQVETFLFATDSDGQPVQLTAVESFSSSPGSPRLVMAARPLCGNWDACSAVSHLKQFEPQKDSYQTVASSQGSCLDVLTDVEAGVDCEDEPIVGVDAWHYHFGALTDPPIGTYHAEWTGAKHYSPNGDECELTSWACTIVVTGVGLHTIQWVQGGSVTVEGTWHGVAHAGGDGGCGNEGAFFHSGVPVHGLGVPLSGCSGMLC